MQFQVPQFIEVEDKIFGPFTFRQFIWMTGGIGLAYILYRLLPVYIAVPLGLASAGFAAALAFAQMNGRPFILWLESAFYYFLKPRLYLWSNNRPTTQAVHAAQTTSMQGSEIYVPSLSESKLHDLAWSLDIKERIASGASNDDDRQRGGGVFSIRTAKDARLDHNALTL